MLARSSRGSLVVCTVTPETWEPPSAARIDAEYGAFLRQNANKALAKAKARMPADLEADFVALAAPSAREGLLRVANDTGADGLVLGSARQARLGHFAQGHVTGGLLHSAHLPVAVAPRGYTGADSARIRRLSIAVSGASTSAGLVDHGAELAQDIGVPLRLVTVVVRDKQMYPSGAGYDAENIVANTMREQAKQAQAELMKQWRHPVAVTSAIADGKSWKAALNGLDWMDAELLIVGSSNLGLLLRVFVSLNSAQILHNAPVPCLVLPRLDG